MGKKMKPLINYIVHCADCLYKNPPIRKCRQAREQRKDLVCNVYKKKINHVKKEGGK